MFYCLFVLNYRNISLADYLSVVFYVYVTNYSQYAKQKKMAGATPLSPIAEYQLPEVLFSVLLRRPTSCLFLDLSKKYLPPALKV